MIEIDFQTIEQASQLITPYIFQTPMLINHWLSDVVNNHYPTNPKKIWVKWENLQLTGSFKLRGALYKMLRLKEQGVEEVLAVSAGNHGLGIAYAAQLLSMKATVIVPKTAAVTKVRAIEQLGAELLAKGDSYDEAELIARQLANEKNIEFVSPYNDPEIIVGQATVALEMLQKTNLDLLISPVGGGGLLSGTGLVAKLNPTRQIDVIGVQPANSTAMQNSFRAGEIVKVEESSTCADGLAGNLEDNTCTFPIVKKYVKDIFTVTEEEIEQTIFNFLHYDHFVVEGSGAVASAALLANTVNLDQYSNIGVIVSGRNIDLSRLSNIINKY
jgi:threonine dehydratase